jgi:hypothetical protein
MKKAIVAMAIAVGGVLAVGATASAELELPPGPCTAALNPDAQMNSQARILLAFLCFNKYA